MSYAPPSRRNKQGRQILQDADLQLRPGASVAVVGRSGAGKSTLLSLCLGLIQPNAGRVLIAGHDLAALNARSMAHVRAKHVGMVFQAGELLPQLTVLDNIALPALLIGTPRASAYGRAEELLAELDLDVEETPTANLSGGERQRVAVARAIVNKPAAVLADEPTGSLDADTRDVVSRLLFDLPSRYGTSLLVVTHDPAVATLADRCLVLESGALRASP